MAEQASIRPSEMVEGGAVPVDQNLKVKEAKFALFDYQGKATPTTAARLILLSDDGVEYTQHYSAADPTRFVPSQDGKSLIPVGSAPALNKSSNFFVLMNNLVSAGFPENKLGNDITALDGLYAYWIGVPAPKRSGLQQTAEQSAKEKIILVPSQIYNLPWEKPSSKPTTPKAGAKAAAAPKSAAPASAPSDGGNTSDAALAFIQGVVQESGSITRQDLAVRVFKDLAKDPNRDAIASMIFSPAIAGLLLANGLKINGETISA